MRIDGEEIVDELYDIVGEERSGGGSFVVAGIGTSFFVR